jgi:hypothetical protein
VDVLDAALAGVADLLRGELVGTVAVDGQSDRAGLVEDGGVRLSVEPRADLDEVGALGLDLAYGGSRGGSVVDDQDVQEGEELTARTVHAPHYSRRALAGQGLQAAGPR